VRRAGTRRLARDAVRPDCSLRTVSAVPRARLRAVPWFGSVALLGAFGSRPACGPEGPRPARPGAHSPHQSQLPKERRRCDRHPRGKTSVTASARAYCPDDHRAIVCLLADARPPSWALRRPPGQKVRRLADARIPAGQPAPSPHDPTPPPQAPGPTHRGHPPPARQAEQTEPGAASVCRHRNGPYGMAAPASARSPLGTPTADGTTPAYRPRRRSPSRPSQHSINGCRNSARRCPAIRSAGVPRAAATPTVSAPPVLPRIRRSHA
jgi:hypothetical protein